MRFNPFLAAAVALVFLLPGAAGAQTPPAPPTGAIPGSLVFLPTNPTTCDQLVMTYTATGNQVNASHTQLYVNLSFNGFVTELHLPMVQQSSNVWVRTNGIPATAANASAYVEGIGPTNAFDTNLGNFWSVQVSACSTDPVPVTVSPTVVTPCTDVTVSYSSSGTVFSGVSTMVFFIVFDNNPNVTSLKNMTASSNGVWTVTYDIPEGPANAVFFFSDGGTNFDDNAGSLYNFAISVCSATPTNVPTNFVFSVRNDLDGDGLGDLLLRDEDSETYSVLLMDGLTSLDRLDLLGAPTDISPFRFVASSDLNGDGVEDLVFREGGSGNHVVAYMEAGEIVTSEYITFGGEQDVSPWHVVAGGDLDGDGFGELVYQNGDSGVYAIAYLDGSEALASEYLFGGDEVDVSPWRLAAGGDLDGDGLCDLVFKYGGSGIYAVAFMEGAAVWNSAYLLGTETDISPWRLVATSDLDGDGWSELIFKFGGQDLYDAAFMDGENVLLSDYLFEEEPILPDVIVGGK